MANGMDDGSKKRINNYKKIIKSIKQVGYNPSEFKTRNLGISNIKIKFDSGESQYLGDPMRIFDIEIKKIIDRFLPYYFRDVNDIQNNSSIVIRLVSIFSIFLMKHAIFLSEDIHINIDDVIEKFIPKSKIDNIKNKILEQSKGADKLNFRYFIEVSKFDFQDLQKANELYKLLFHINICHDISAANEYRKIDEYLNIRHTIIHEEKGIVGDIYLNNVLIFEMIKDFTIFCHSLYNIVKIRPQEMVFNDKTKKWESL